MFLTPRRSASAFARFSTSGERSMPTTRFAQRAASTEIYPSPHAMSATSTGGSSSAERPRPCGPAAAGHELRAVGAVDLEVFLAEPNDLLQPRFVARTAGVCAASANCACSAAHNPRTRRRAGQERGDKTKIRRRVLRSRGRLPSAAANAATRRIARCPRTAVSSVTFSRPCRPASTRSRRSPLRRPGGGRARRPVSHP